MLWRLPIAKLAVSVIVGAVIVVGQQPGSDVTTCIEPYDWSINARNQTPCVVAAFLESACGSVVIVPALPPGNSYLGPNASQQNECLCSSVTYSMVSACAGCQGRNFQNWTTWTLNCLGTSLTKFPLTVSTDVVVPQWAFLNVSASTDTFDPILAEESLSGIGPSSSSSLTTTPTFTATSQGSESTSPAAVNSSPEKHSNTGAIAGGVVGGLVLLAVVGLGLLWWYMRKKRHAVQMDMPFDSRALVAGNVMSQPTGSSHLPDSGTSTAPYSSPLYGTSTDLSAYPGSPVTSAVYTTVPGSRRSMESISHSLAHFGGLQTLAPIRKPPGYSGAAEV